jgi:hypothetical protein
MELQRIQCAIVLCGWGADTIVVDVAVAPYTSKLYALWSNRPRGMICEICLEFVSWICF